MRPVLAAAIAIVAAVGAARLAAQRGAAFVVSRDHPAIRYSTAPVTDPVSRLNHRLETGEASLAFEPATGYLRAVLSALDVPVESQVAVFSQTSFQASLINAGNPRAVYFNDTVQVGWVRGGKVLEVAAEDPQQGVIFYMLEQQQTARPRFMRHDACLACHLSPDTLGVPGLMVLSSFPPPADKNAYAIGQAIDHRTRLEQRWGGWYVTGRTGVGHMGNGAATVDDQRWDAVRHPVELSALDGQFDTAGYLSAHSDVAALMVLEHQAHVTNLLTRMNWESRVGSPARRLAEAAGELADYLLFVDEEPLRHPISGSSGFAARFSAGGPRDGQGRSLRQLDLKRRLMTHPCSYMIYSPAFDALPGPARDLVYRRMWEILTGRETSARYRSLSAADRRAVLEILVATKPDLPAYFTAKEPPAAGPAAAQSNPPWTPPRTPWGAPDLQGVWTSDDARSVPLQRPARFGERQLLTDEELAERTRRDDETRADTRAGAGTFVGEVGTRTLPQTSLVVDPPDGRIPAVTSRAQQRAALAAATRAARPASWEDRSISDRCITRGVLGLLPAIYGNGLRIVQNPALVAITHEMIHETRLIPLDGRPHLPSSMRQYMGDSRGHWEGETLVVDTTNFTDKTTVGQTPTSRALHLVERLTRVADDMMTYEVTIEDPDTWVTPWRIRLPLTTQPGYQIYPYDCHEGNFALANILRAARAEEQAVTDAIREGQAPPPPTDWQGNEGFLPADPSFGRRR
jgi:hypothetical protein